MNATRSPAVSRPSSTSVPPYQKMTVSPARNAKPTPDQNADCASARRRASPNRSSTAAA